MTERRSGGVSRPAARWWIRLTTAAVLALGAPVAVAAVAASAVGVAQAAVVAEDDGSAGQSADPAAPADPAPADPAPADPAPASSAPAEPEPAPAASNPEPTATDTEPEPEPSPAKPTKPKKPGKPAADDESSSPEPEPADAASDDPSPEPSDEASPSEDSLVDAEPSPSDEATDAIDEMASDEPSVEPSAEPSDEPTVEAVDEEVTADGDVLDEVSSVQSPGGGDLSVDIRQGKDGIYVDVSGAGLTPGSRVEVWAFSTPTLVTTGTADAEGNFSASTRLPDSLGEGEHTIVVKGVDAADATFEVGTGISIGAGGTLEAVTPGVDIAALGLAVPQLPSSPKAPPYAPVVALDNPDAVTTTTVAAFALVAVAGAATAAAAGARAAGQGSPGGSGSRGSGSGSGSGSDGPSDQSINESLYGTDRDGDDLDVSHNRGWRTRFTPQGSAPGDVAKVHQLPGTAFVDEASFVAIGALATTSPLLSRSVADGAPVRAITGSASLLLPIAGVVLGVVSAVTGEGIAQPPALALLIAMIAISVFDAFAGILAAVAFSVVVAVMGGIIDWSSVRTLMGVAMLIVGPGFIAASFRTIRRRWTSGSAAAWERLLDITLVPLLGAYTAYNIAKALPPLGGSAFPVADSAMAIAVAVALALVGKVLVEMAAARWFPERLATVTVAEPGQPGIPQQIVSGLLRAVIFLFVSAAFIGAPWQLWVAGAIYLVPFVIIPFSRNWPNLPKLWQATPKGLPFLMSYLIVFAILTAILFRMFGSSPEYALMAFVILAIPDLVLSLMGTVSRRPAEGDVLWYTRPNFVLLYRVGGVVVLAVTAWLVVLTSS